MAAKLGNIASDCGTVLKIAGFWSAVLGRPLDQSSGELWASIGGTDAARQGTGTGRARWTMRWEHRTRRHHLR